ncbi:hypothetical protein H7J81_18125 [Mycobacterium cookii]|nr:hypothetical protein [Mycobacterium cookii]
MVSALAVESSPPVVDPNVVGQQRVDLVPATVCEELVDSLVGSARGILETSRWWAFSFESSVEGV